MSDSLPSIEDLLKKQSSDPAAQNDATTQAPEPEKKALEDAAPKEVLAEKMVTIEHKSKESQAKKKAASLGISYVDLKGFPISPDALTLLTHQQAEDLKAITFLFNGPELRMATVNPENQEVKDLLFQLEERNKTNGELYQISQQSFNEAIKLYDTLPKIIKSVKGIQIKEEELAKYQDQMEKVQDIAGVLKGASVTNILAIVMAAALKLGSSDIHIEAEEKRIAVRLRIDGILQVIAEIEKEKWKKIINRIKLVAGLKLNITDRPQDGRFTIYQKDKKIDVRTSTMPTAWGESVVMRILNPDSIKLKFEDLGFRKAALSKLLKEIEKPHGMIVTTGPTGSGKTTTLYAILSRLNKPGVKIITLEDPVEYKLAGINQSQIDHSKDYTFAKGLRSILRQDPDIVMVGEIRDLETAETAIQAALTGHMMISTIHTNDAAGAIPRFTSMGVKAFLLAPAINAIMGQRLARRLCSECKKPATLDEATMKQVKELLESIPETSGEAKVDTSNMQLMTGEGCDKCNGTGYKGRVGLYEILIKDAAIEKFILSGEVSEYAVREVAAKQGMVTMAQDGLLKALEGHTSVEEVKRVTGL
jgi:type II secretory ATPase GspE/PulE/Tfp pilus assembly ATPase PilB-like protein